MPSLVLSTFGGATHRYEVTTQPLRVGRADCCDIVLPDDAEVSREHAEIWIDDRGHILVSDTNSKNGTRVDDREAFRNETHPAFRIIRIGGHELAVADAPSPAAASISAITFVPDTPESTGTTRFFPSSRGLDLSQQRLALLMSLTARIGGAFERKQLLEQALDACCEALNFERGLIALKTPRGEAELPVTRNVETDESGAYKISRTLINRALIHGERAVVNNPATDLVGNLSDSLVRFPICSALCVPIFNREEILGVIYGDRITRAATYTSSDVDFLAAIAQQVGIGLANLSLFKEYVRSQKMYAELEAARQIQCDLLPAAPLRAGSVAMDGYNEPSSAVGGDYFDYFPLGDDAIGFVIADVTGHGLPAALIVANLQAAVRGALTASTPLPELTNRINRLIYDNTTSSVFITAILGRIHSDSGMIEYVNAGHPQPIIVGQSDTALSAYESSLPLGVDLGEEYSVHRIEPSQHAGVLLFYTDGLIEAESTAGQMLGLEMVTAALAALSRPGTEATLRTTLEIVRAHLAGKKNADDLTLLAIQYRP
ncbi:MAG: SpoIIE family protein phosphatase [Planctomycetota bacterium]